MLNPLSHRVYTMLSKKAEQYFWVVDPRLDMSFEISNKRPVLEWISGKFGKFRAQQEHAVIIDPTWKTYGQSRDWACKLNYPQVEGENYEQFSENRESDASSQLWLNCRRFGN